MSEFDIYGIPVRLKQDNRTVLTRVRDDHDKYACMVVFADPKKLSFYTDPLCRDDEVRHSLKVQDCRSALSAATATSNDPMPVCGLNEHPIPIAIVNCWTFRPDGKPDVTFTDGITRTGQLIRMGAEFVPVQVATGEAELLHKTVGGVLPPRPASDYIVPHDIRMEKMTAYYAQRRKLTPEPD